MTQCNFRTRLKPNLFSGHFDKVGTVLASRYAHSSCARMTREAKTGYTTSLTSSTSPNSSTTYCAYSSDNRTLTRFLQRFFFSLHFSRVRKNLCYQGTDNAETYTCIVKRERWLSCRGKTRNPFRRLANVTHMKKG